MQGREVKRMKGKWIRLMAALLLIVSCIGRGLPEACAMNVTAASDGGTETTEAVGNTDNIQGQFLVNISYGIDSLISYIGNTPVQITITNQGEDFTGEVTLTVVRDYAKNFGYGTDISIPAGATKSVFMTVPEGAGYTNCVVRILDDKEDIMFERTIMNNISGDVTGTIIGALSDDYAALNYLDGMSVMLMSNTFDFRLGQMTEETMPDIASALNSCKIIVIDNYDTSRLSDAQYQALRQWVEKGGVLLLGTGAEYNKVLSKFKDDFVSGSIGDLSKKQVNLTVQEEPETLTEENEQPAASTGSSSQQEPEDAKVIQPDIINEEYTQPEPPMEEQSQMKTTSGDTLSMDVLDISVDGGTPVENVADGELFIEKSLGVGKVIVCKTGLSMEPFAGYKGNTRIIYALLNEVITRDLVNAFNGISMDTNEYNMGSNIVEAANETKMPNPLKYTILFLIYILIVGPGIYIILKLKDKSKALWLAIPGSALVFTLGVYVVSINDTVRHPIVNSYIIEQYEEESKNVSASFAAMNPKSGAYQLNLNNAYSDVNQADYDYYYDNMFRNNSSASCLVKETVDHTVLKMSKAQAFTKMYLRASASVPTEKNIDIDIQLYKDGFSGTVTNNLDHDLINVIVFEGGFCSYIDRLEAGSSKEIKKDNSQMIIYDTYQLADAFLPPETYKTDQKKYNMVQYMGNAVTNLYYLLESGEGFLAGYEEGAEVDLIADSEVDEYGWVLAIKKFTAAYKDIKGNFTGNIHRDCLESSNYEWDTQYGYMWDAQEIIADYEFSEMQITDLYKMPAAQQVQGYQEADCYIWNPSTGAWDQIFKGADEFSLAGYYLDEDETRIQLKFTNPLLNGNGTNLSDGTAYIPIIGGGEN